jgi:hypothetical protein
MKKEGENFRPSLFLFASDKNIQELLNHASDNRNTAITAMRTNKPHEFLAIYG